MAATIGTIIKRLRHGQDMTQEQLADYLGLSAQAISQWERDISAPDISLLVPIANVFGVTIDALFDRTAAAEAEDVERYTTMSSQFSREGRILDDLAVWREAAAKYPRNFECLKNLAYALLATLTSGDAVGEDREKNAKEAIGICERILEACTDGGIRSSAIQILVLIYGQRDLACADEEKAEKYAYMADCFYACREVLLERAYFRDAEKEKERKGQNNLMYMDALHLNLLYTGETAEERIFACETLLSIWKLLVYDGNYLFYHCRIADIYANLASIYASLGDKAKTMENLRLSLKHAAAYDAMPAGEQKFTSLFIDRATSNTEAVGKNYTETDVGLRKRMMRERSVFDFIRDDPEFIALLES